MIRCILVPLDHSAFAEEALVPAVSLARTFDARLDVALVHEQPKLVKLRRTNWTPEQVEQENRYLEHIGDRLAKHGVERNSHAVLSGDVEEAIIERARAVGADMIVLKSHGSSGFGRARLGSVAYALVHDSGLPILVLRDADRNDAPVRTPALFRRILVPVDGSDASHTILPAAMELARNTGATIVLLRVVEPVPMFGVFTPADFATGPHPFGPPGIQDIEATERVCVKARESLDATVAMLADESVPHIEARVVVADRTSSAIIDYAAATEVDLIAMSTHGWGDSSWTLGSVTDAVLRNSRIPLLLTRPTKSAASARMFSPSLRQLTPVH